MDIKFQTKEEFFSSIDLNKDILTDEDLKIYGYVKENYKKVSFMNIDEICVELDLDEKSINSFSSKVGFSDYEGLRNNLRQIIMAQLKSTERFKISMDLKKIDINRIAEMVISKEIKNLTNLLGSIDVETLKEIMEEIINAEDMIVVATRASAPIAIYAEYIFNRIGKKTRKIISGGTENFDDIVAIERNALVLAFGFARYPKETVRALNFFKKKNFKIISITDNLMSPLAHFSNLVLTVPYESVSFTDSYAVPISIVNILVILLSQYDEEKTLKYLNEFEDIAKDMGFFF